MFMSVINPGEGDRPAVPPLNWEREFGLYAYVGADPVNRIDPDGKTCVSLGEGKGYQCKVDDPGKFNKAEIAATNEAYTAAVNKLMYNPDKAVRVTLMGRSMTVKAGDIARGLIGAHVIGGSKLGDRASTQGGTLAGGSTRTGRVEITIGRSALYSDRSGGTANAATDLRKTFIHEGIHTTQGQRAFAPLYNKDPTWFNKFHLKYYNEASSIFHDGYND